MRPLKAIAVYAVVVILLGALLAPWLYWLVQWLAATFEPCAGLARHPFRRLFNRSLQLVAVLGLWPLLRNLGYRSWAEVGYTQGRSWPREVGLGWVLGIGSLAVAVGLTLVLGRRQLVYEEIAVGGLLFKLFLTGAVVALIEETFFRGAIQGALQRTYPAAAALVASSVIYSALHFLKPQKFKLAAADVTAWSGFDCLEVIVSRSLAAEGILVAFVSLFLAGLVLGWTFYRTGRLSIAIGLHAGWVLANELVRELGGGKVIEDWLTWLAVLVLWAGMAWWLRNEHQPTWREPAGARTGSG